MCPATAAAAERASSGPVRAGLRAEIEARARAIGFDAIGFARAELAAGTRERLLHFLADGRHGDMGWLASRADERGAPRVLWPEAVSVISLGLSYAPAGDPLATLDRRDRGNISVYARNRDYHDVVKGMLKQLAGFIVARAGTEPGVKVFVDTAPVMEKPLAQSAGLGWQGKHTNLVSRRHGSWLFLGEILTTLAFEGAASARDACGSCTRCLAACPTEAFVAPYQLDARRCISYLTIEHPGPIPVEFRAAIGNRIYGCDDCLAVCPWNRFARAGRHLKLAARDAFAAPELRTLAALDDAAFRAMFSASPVKRLGRDRFVRNVATAIGNSADRRLLGTARRLCRDASALVRDAAEWAHERLAASR